MPKKSKVIPRLKPVPYTIADLEVPLRQPQLVPVTTTPTGSVQLYSTPDLPNNKRGFKYVACRPNPYFSSTLYSTTDTPPYGVHWSYYDRSPEMYVDTNMTIAGTQEGEGWRSTRANVAIREGKWYVEYRIVSGIDTVDDGNAEEESMGINGAAEDHQSRSVTPMPRVRDNLQRGMLESHVRIGLARREAALEAPVGFDGYGYGIRDIGCEKIHLSKRGKIGNDCVDLKVGDVIGLLIELPPIEVQKEISKRMILQKTLTDPVDTELIMDDQMKSLFVEKGIEREMIPIKYKGEMFFEEFEYTGSKAMEHLLNPVKVFGERAVPDEEKFQPAKLPSSSIKLYVNGEYRGEPFSGLYMFLPPASEQRMARKETKKKQQEEKFIVDNDDGSLGYYPMVSCFRGGAVEINKDNKPWRLPDTLAGELEAGTVRMYGDRSNQSVVEEFVYDLLDNTVNTYLDSRERELATSYAAATASAYT